jgi:drug/metabolite transporter (DMT)-like permease
MSEQPAVAITASHPPLRAYLILIMGVSAVSLSAIFIRYAQADGVPSLFIAAGRLTIATLLLTPITLRNHWPELRGLTQRELGLAFVSGFFLAIHFATWILSLEYTSVLIGGVLVSTSPLWAGILEVIFLRARFGQVVIGGLLISLVGGVIATFSSEGGFNPGTNPVLGSLLAVTGAICVAVYLVIGRKLRAGLSLLPYIWLVYGCAAILLLLAVVLLGIPMTGYPTQSYLWIAAMAILPQLFGHSSFNYVLKYLSATFIGIATQLESVVSALIALVIFNELPGEFQILGCAIILIGVILASLGQNRTKQAA